MTIKDIIGIKKEERKLSCVALLFFATLNALTVLKYWAEFSEPTNSYTKLFVRVFKISGFDPLTYTVVSDWQPAYNVYRHPLLAFFFYPVYLINEALMWLTGINFGPTLVGIILTLCGTYSAIFLYRIEREIIGLGRKEAQLLTAMLFSFGYIMLSAMVPDHFIMSMTVLLMTLWLAGRKLRNGSALNMRQTIVMFILTAGISLNNGLKTFLAALMTRRKRFFRPGFLLLAVVLPALAIWGFARWEYRYYVWPNEMKRHKAKMERNERLLQEIRDNIRDTMFVAAGEDTATTNKRVEAEVKRIQKVRANEKFKRDRKKVWNKNTGKPIMQGEFMRWTDISTSRWDSSVENLFGEAIQLHKDHLLEDVLKKRPVIVQYRLWANYIVEGIIVLLFLIGLFIGRKDRFLWTAMSFFLMDIVLHVGLGFGINEIYIMSAHYLFCLPIAIGYILKYAREMKIMKMRYATYALVGCVTLWCYGWNIWLIADYLLLQ